MYEDQLFNISGPIVSSREEASSRMFTRVPTEKAVWYYTDGENAASNIYCSTRNKEGMGGATVEMHTPDGVFPETGIWHSNADSLFNATGIDIRDKHLTSYIVCLEIERPKNWYEATLCKQVQAVELSVVGEFNPGKEVAQRIANKLDRKVFFMRKSTGGGSSGWINPQEVQLNE